MICPSCNRENPSSSRFCEECGAALSIESTPAEIQPVAEGAAVSDTVPLSSSSASENTQDSSVEVSEPVSVPESTNVPPVFFTEGHVEKPISTWGWIGIFILLNIPVVSAIMTIVWACSAKRHSLKSFARALIIVFLLSVILILVCLIVLRFMGVNTSSIIANAFSLNRIRAFIG